MPLHNKGAEISTQLPLRMSAIDMEVIREPQPSQPTQHLFCQFSRADTNWSDCSADIHLLGSRKFAKKLNDMRSGALQVVGTNL